MSEPKKISSKVYLVFWLGLLSTVFMTSSYASESVWAKMAQHDLKTTKQLIIKNVPKAQVANSFYRNWLTRGYKLANVRAKLIHTYSGYISTMEYYLMGFKDYHTDVVPLLKMVNPSAMWPGFIVGQRNNRIIVNYSKPGFDANTKIPPVGAQLLSCNGMSTELLIHKDLIPFTRANSRYPSTWQKYIPQLFVWTENPFIQKLKTCIFIVNRKRHTYKLQWKVTQNPSPLSLGVPNFEQKLNAASFGPTPLFSTSTFGVKAVWVSIPIFAYGLSTQGTTTTKLLDHVAQQVKKYRNKRLILFDLRGNTGGDPQYTRPIIMNLYGKAYLRHLGKQFVWSQPKKVSFLATKINLQHMIQSASPKAMITGMKAAIAKGAKSYLYQQQVLKPGRVSSINLVKATVVLLTNGRCGSECDSFVLAMKSIPGVVQVGQPTAPVTNSTWNAVKVFADNASAVIYPTGLILSPKVKDGAPFFPRYLYHGDMANTQALKHWVWRLYEDKKFQRKVASKQSY